MDLNPGWENERTSAFEWLMEDPENRALESPGYCDAVLNLWSARDQFPNQVFTREQFTSTRLPAAIGRSTRLLPFHLYTF